MAAANTRDDVSLQAVLFDFGGVLAEEGFREGLKEIARRNHLDPGRFYQLGSDAVYDSGYVTGEATEESFWKLLCSRSGLGSYERHYTDIILNNFRLRPQMLEQVRELKRRDATVAILSDQTDWLDRLERRYHFFHLFDRVFNSFHLGMSKRDPEIFDHVVRELGVEPAGTLFVDDSEGHIARAADRGLKTLRFGDPEESLERLSRLLGTDTEH